MDCASVTGQGRAVIVGHRVPDGTGGRRPCLRSRSGLGQAMAFGRHFLESSQEADEMREGVEK